MHIAPSVPHTGTSPVQGLILGDPVSFETSWAPVSGKESHLVTGSGHMSTPQLLAPPLFRELSNLVSLSHEFDAVLGGGGGEGRGGWGATIPFYRWRNRRAEGSAQGPTVPGGHTEFVGPCVTILMSGREHRIH